MAPGLGPLVVAVARVAQGACRVQALDELVTGVVEGMREVERKVAQLGLDWMAENEVRVEGVTGADGVRRPRVERGRRRKVVTRVGRLVVRRMGYRAAVAGVPMLFPLDGVLNLPASSYSHELAELVVMFCREVSYEKARGMLAAVTGVTVGKRQLQQVMRAASADAEAFCDAGRDGEPVPLPLALPAGGPVPGGPGGEAVLPLALSADGKGVSMRPGSRRKRTKAPGKKVQTYQKRAVAGEKKGTKRIAQVSCAFDVIPVPRTPEEVMASHCGAGTAGPAPAGAKKKKKGKKPAPEAVNRRYRADIAADRSESVKWLSGEAGRRDPARERERIVLAGGDNHQIALIRKEAARRGVTVTLLIDVIHVAEYIWKAGWALFPARDPAIEEWAAAQVLDILRGHAGQVADRIAALAAANPPRSPEHAKNIARTTGYLRAKIPYLDYPRALAAGWPVATGVIEGACRHVVQDRMGITGARWTTDGAQAVLWHRAIDASGDARTYWAYHLQQEKHRNHLSKYQNPGTLDLAA